MEGNVDPMSTAAARQCTSAHVSRCTSRIVKDIGFEQLSHPPYSTDLAPSDFHLFRHLKKHLRRKRICGDDEVKQATETCLNSMHQESIWLEWGTFLANVAIVLMWREIVLKTDVVVLPVSFVHHTELQNFLIAPRISASLKVPVHNVGVGRRKYR